MMDFLYLSIIFILLFLNSVIAESKKTDDIRYFLGTRTPYRLKYNKDDTKIKYKNCKEQKIWMLIRHGSRLPSAKDIIGAQTTLYDLKYEVMLKHNKGKGYLTEEQIKKLEKWTSDMPVEQEKYLTLEGQDEMILLAERVQTKFPNIIHQKYDNNTYQFRYTATQRTQQSARYFSLGLFDKKNAEKVVFEPALKVDTTLRFYKHCQKWQTHVKKNPDSYKEMQLYGTSKEMNETLEYVSKYLGLDRILSLDTVTLIYRICGFETAWHKFAVSPWCYAFDAKGMKINYAKYFYKLTLEYYYDLRHYWVDGYGHEFTHRPACMLLKHMLHNMSNKGRSNATFLFAHSGTMLKMLTYLQMYKPESHLRGDTMNEKRAWRLSNIDCFAANLAFVLYKCKDGDKILTLHQEKIVKLPMCESELCPVKTIKDYYRDSLNSCNFNDMCNVT